MTKFFNDTLNVLTNVKRGMNTRDYPFPHAVAPLCLPQRVYEELVRTRPSWESIAGDRKDENNKRIDIPAIAALQSDIAPIWKDFIEYHTSENFYKLILKKFGNVIKEYYPDLKLEDLKTGIRWQKEDADIYLDCQIGINTPVKEKSTVSVPHLDSPKELWAGLLYMREKNDGAGGNLLIYQCRNIPKMYGKRFFHEEDLILVDEVEYDANTFICFVNTPLSIHAVTERDISDRPRLLVNFSIEFMKDGEELFDLGRFPS